MILESSCKKEVAHAPPLKEFPSWSQQQNVLNEQDSTTVFKTSKIFMLNTSIISVILGSYKFVKMLTHFKMFVKMLTHLH
jgi:hypothetical protein